MATVTLKGNPVRVSGELPAVGSAAPDFTLTKTDLSETRRADLAGRRVVLNIFPSIDTATCAASTRTFNARATEAANTRVLCVSADLPFAQKRFCAAEGLDRVIPVSTFRHPEFLEAYGVRIEEGGLRGLCARAVVVLDEDGTVIHTELVPEIGQEPDYDSALQAIQMRHTTHARSDQGSSE
ncbi:MAG TPA: thiol peroxidase [Holophagaceae bacterium]|nr:thiol peroxidase [Holophagaceae bacterium]